MEEETQEQPMDDMTPDEAAASLAFATKLSEGMMPQAPVEGDMGAETPQGEEQIPETEQAQQLDPEALKTDILGEVEKKIDSKFDELKKILTEALSEDDDEETEDKKNTE